MAVYVDDLREYSTRPGLWCHMVADTLEELHAMARTIGIPRSRFQARARNPHYDLRPELRDRAIAAGAQPASRREIVRVLRASRSDLAG